MAETLELKATSRDVVGKANRRLDDGELAGVVYGHGTTSKAISVDRHEFELLVAHDEALFSKLIKLTVDDHKPVNVIVKAVQRDPTKGNLKHIDFWAIRMTQAIQTTVTVHFLGEAPGLKQGGVMMHNLQQLAIEAMPADLPESVSVDISALEIGDSVHVSDIVAPKGVTILDALDEIVASVVPPAKLEEEVVEEVAEPEIIGEAPADEE